jgi:ABC-type glucose/galactose transport system permease subunit
VYTFNGFCSALAGLANALFVFSGHGLYAPGMEMDVIASVIMGGTMLSGGSGYVLGTFFGVLVLAVTQVLIQFIGSLSSWWTKIVIGALTLIFIGVQTVLSNRKNKGKSTLSAEAELAAKRKNLRLALGVGIIAILVVVSVFLVSKFSPDKVEESAESTQCQVAPFREEEATQLILKGAVIVYHRTAGPTCVDEMYAIYPDGKVTGSNGVSEIEKQATPDQIKELLTAVSVEHGWFTNDVYSTYLTPCRQCFAHYIDISYDGQQKAITGVDGTTALPPGYAFALAQIRPFLPTFTPVP